MNTELRQNYYEILDINETATAQEIRSAYEKAKITYAHDNKAVLSMFSHEEAKELRVLIEEAYEVLSNNDYRNVYERRIMANTFEAKDLTAEAIKSASDDLFERATPPVVVTPTQTFSTTDDSLMVASAPIENSSLAGLEMIEESATEIKTESTDLNEAPVLDKNFENLIAAKKEWTGEDLKEVREYRKLSYDELTDITKINPWYIAALEKMDPANLPVEVFVRGYVLQVAKALGLKDKVVAESYMRLFRKKIEN